MSDTLPKVERAAWRARVSSETGSDETEAVVVTPAADGGRLEGSAELDGRTVPVRLDRRDEARALLVEREDGEPWRTPVLFGPRRAPDPSGAVRRELVVDGWRVEVEVELEARAALREAARRTGSAGTGGGEGRVRAIIPGKIVAVDVRPGDPVVAGQRLLVLEAMKMQNELIAPREGVVQAVAVAPGATVERGDLLVEIR